jgi:hypothetical protein
VPAVGALFALALLAYAAWRNDTPLSRVALSMFVVIGVASIAVYFTGEAAEEAVENLPGVSEQLIERHEEAASVATIILGGFGLYALLVLALLRRRDIPRWLNTMSLVAALVASGAVVWTAGLGGQIRHSEIRSGASAADAQGPVGHFEKD